MKSPEMEKFLDQFTMKTFGRKRAECIKKGICVECGGSACKFRDTTSLKEFNISALCQSCQDSLFGKD